MSDYFDNSISIDNILAEFHAENDFLSRVAAQDSDSSGLGDMDLTIDQVHKDVPSPEKVEELRKKSLPTEEEIRAYMAVIEEKDFLNIAEDLSTPVPNHEEIDRRFRVDGKPAPTSYLFDGEEVRAEVDSDYHPSVQKVDLENEGSSDRFSDFKTRQSSRKVAVSRRVGGKKERLKKLDLDSDDARLHDTGSSSYDDYTSYAIPIAEDNIAEKYPFEEREAPEEDENGLIPDSFKSYLAGILASVVYRLKGARGAGYSGDATEDDEFLGKEVKPAAASKYYGSQVKSLQLRFRVCAVLWLILFWISVGLPVPGLLKSVYSASALCVAIQFAIMLLGLDVITNALANIGVGKAGIDLLATVSCIVTAIDGLLVARSSSVSPHLPLCVVSSFSLIGVLLASLLSARGLRKSLRVPAIGKTVYAVTGETAAEDAGMTLLKSSRPIDGFVRRAEEAPFDEELFGKVSLFILLGALFFALITALAKSAFSDFVFIFSAFLAAAVPCAALLSFSLPFFIGSMRIFSSGAAIAGWSGLCDVGQSSDIIVTDRDIFPKGSVEIDSVRVFSDTDPNKVISYAGSLIAPSGMASSESFIDLMKSAGVGKSKVENFEFLAAGGIRGIIGGERVLCGNVDLMRLMNVRVPAKLVDKNSVLLAIDGILCGIFNMKYTPLKKVRAALVELTGSNRHAVFAIRDFNVTPNLLKTSFDIATDGYEFPPYLERFRLSAAKATKGSKIAAVVCRETLGPLVEMADAGRSMFLATNINTWICFASSIIGILFVLIRFLSAGFVTPAQILVFALLFTLPVFLISFFTVKK